MLTADKRKGDRCSLAERVEEVVHRVAVFAARDRHQNAIAFGDHLKVVDRARHRAREAFFDALGLGRCGHLRTLLLHELEEGEHAVPGAALRVERGGAVAERRAGDVGVDPVALADELAQEERRGDRSAPAFAGVLQVGDVALQLILQIFEQRQPPELLAGIFGGCAELRGELARSLRRSRSTFCPERPRTRR